MTLSPSDKQSGAKNDAKFIDTRFHNSLPEAHLPVYGYKCTAVYGPLRTLREGTGSMVPNMGGPYTKGGHGQRGAQYGRSVH